MTIVCTGSAITTAGPTTTQWAGASEGKSLADVDPYSSRAITDFYAYDSYVHVPCARRLRVTTVDQARNRIGAMLNGGYSEGKLSPRYQSGVGPEQFGGWAEWGGQDSGHQGLGATACIGSAI